MSHLLTKEQLWDEHKMDWAGCEECPLHKTRKNIVLGEGDLDANFLFVGEAPGEKEDQTGRPFVGRAGKRLRKAIKKAKFKRFFISNVVSCRPPDNRKPTQGEVSRCGLRFRQLVEIIEPKIVIVLGKSAGEAIFMRFPSIKRIRGNLMRTYIGRNQYTIVPTFHPSYVLRSHDEEVAELFENDLILAKKALKSAT